MPHIANHTKYVVKEKRVSENIGGSASPDPASQNRYPADYRSTDYRPTDYRPADYSPSDYRGGDHHTSKVVSDREWARKKIIRRRALITHAVAYFAVNLLLVVIWFFTGAGYFWPGWVIAGWGVGLLLDAASVLLQTEITDEQIDRELRNRKP